MSLFLNFRIPGSVFPLFSIRLAKRIFKTIREFHLYFHDLKIRLNSDIVTRSYMLVIMWADRVQVNTLNCSFSLPFFPSK